MSSNRGPRGDSNCRHQENNDQAIRALDQLRAARDQQVENLQRTIHELETKTAHLAFLRKRSLEAHETVRTTEQKANRTQLEIFAIDDASAHAASQHRKRTCGGRASVSDRALEEEEERKRAKERERKRDRLQEELDTVLLPDFDEAGFDAAEADDDYDQCEAEVKQLRDCKASIQRSIIDLDRRIDQLGAQASARNMKTTPGKTSAPQNANTNPKSDRDHTADKHSRKTSDQQPLESHGKRTVTATSTTITTTTANTTARAVASKRTNQTSANTESTSSKAHRSGGTTATLTSRPRIQVTRHEH